MFPSLRSILQTVVGVAVLASSSRTYGDETNNWLHVSDGNQTTLATLHRWNDVSNWSLETVPNGDTAKVSFASEADLGTGYATRTVLLPDGEVSINLLYQKTYTGSSATGGSIQYLGDKLQLSGDHPKISYYRDGPNIITFLKGGDLEIAGEDSKRNIYLHGPTDLTSLKIESGGVNWYMQEYATNAVTSAETQTEQLFNPNMVMYRMNDLQLQPNSGSSAVAATSCTAEKDSYYLELGNQTPPGAGALAHESDGYFSEGSFVVWARNLGTSTEANYLVRMSAPALKTGAVNISFDAVPALPTRQRVACFTTEGYNSSTFRLNKANADQDLVLTFARTAITNSTIYLTPSTKINVKNGLSGLLELEDTSDCKNASIKLESGNLLVKNIEGNEKNFNKLTLEANKYKDNQWWSEDSWSAIEVADGVTLKFNEFTIIGESTRLPALLKRGNGELRLGKFSPTGENVKPYHLEVEAGRLIFTNETEVTMSIPSLTLKSGITLRAEGAPVRISCDTLSCAEEVTVSGPIVFEVANHSIDSNWQNLKNALSDGAQFNTPSKVYFGWNQTGTEVDVENGTLEASEIPTIQPSAGTDGRKFYGWYDENGIMYINAQGQQVLYFDRENMMLNPGYVSNLVDNCTLKFGYIQSSNHNISIEGNSSSAGNRMMFVPVEEGETYLITLSHDTNRLRVQFTNEIVPNGSTATYNDNTHTTFHPNDTNGSTMDVTAPSKLRVTAPTGSKYLYIMYLSSTDNKYDETLRSGMFILNVNEIETLNQRATARLLWGRNRTDLIATNGRIAVETVAAVTGVPTGYNGCDIFVGWYDAENNCYFDVDGTQKKLIVRTTNLFPAYVRNYQSEGTLVNGYIQYSTKKLFTASDQKDWMLYLNVEAGQQYEVTITNLTKRFRIEFTDAVITRDTTTTKTEEYAKTALIHPSDTNADEWLVLPPSKLQGQVPAGYNKMYVFFYSDSNSQSAAEDFRQSVIVRCLDDIPVLYPARRGLMLLFK